MHQWLQHCERWLAHQYKYALQLSLAEGTADIRWLSEDSLSKEVARDEASGLLIEDQDIGWLMFVLPYQADRVEQQVNQALGLRSRLLREANYTGNEAAGADEDEDSTWRVGLVWLVAEKQWENWQQRILQLRRESGAAEEISFDAVRIERDDVEAALDVHGMPRLLLHTRALLSQSVAEAENWLSADAQVSSALNGFAQDFDAPRSRAYARQLEERITSFEASEPESRPVKARAFHRFRVQHFRNLKSLEVVAEPSEDMQAQAIVMFGPNGTGKSSFAEALSLAAFGTSPRLEEFLEDKDLRRVTAETYLKDYIGPFDASDSAPSFVWAESGSPNGDGMTPFSLRTDPESQSRYDGVVLNQQDSIEFTEMPRESLAARVVKGYSGLADDLSAWLAQEERRANDDKHAFTRKHGMSGAIKLSKTAYKGLAERLLQTELQRPSPEFIEWLRFWGKMADEDGQRANRLSEAWASQQATVTTRLAEALAKLQEDGAEKPLLSQTIHERLTAFDDLARQSIEFRGRMESRIAPLRDQLETALTQIETWGAWLASRKTAPAAQAQDQQGMREEIEKLSKQRTEVERKGKSLRARLDLLDTAKQFLTSHWAPQHPGTCPVCDSDVSNRRGIDSVVTTLQEETGSTIQSLRTRFVEIQKQEKTLDAKLRAAGLSTCPLAEEDLARLRDWLTPFLSQSERIEDRLVDPNGRQQLKGDLSRMQVLPEPPRPSADALLEANRLAEQFIARTQEADRALEDPQAIGEVKKAFEQRLEKVLKTHLPSTLQRVWLEITGTLTTASWLLPAPPALKLEQRGKSLSVQAGERGQFVRYVYNAAERHVLGLAWFFTFYLAKRRFEEAWLLLDDPAQEMDQPSFRELVRFLETLLRIHQKSRRPLTAILTLHQEDRALDATRATNGRLYVLGWQKEQQDTAPQSSVKKIVLLAPGFHPLKPAKVMA